MYIGENIKYLRLQNNMSQEDLATALGYKSYTTITKWESGVSEPTLKMANQIADYFKISVNDLCYKKLSKSAELSYTYYLNDETAAIAQEIFVNDKVLFDVYRSSSKDRLIAYAKKLKELKDMEEGNI